MTNDSRRTYFRLWATACRAQGWDAKDEALRRDVTLEVCGESSTSRLDEKQITKLYDYLKQLADSLSLKKAMPVANLELGEEEHFRRRFLHVIDGLGFADGYIVTTAKGHCNNEGKSQWRDLSSTSLEKLSWTLKTRARKRDAGTGKRRSFEPRSEPYHRRTSTKAAKAAAREPQVVPRPSAITDECSTLLPF